MANIKGWNFPVDVDEATGKIKLAEDNENVKQGIRLILGTQRGERKVRLSFGTDINQFVFGSVNQGFVDELSREVGQSIKMWEKYISDLRVMAEQSPQNNAVVKVDVSYITQFSPEIEGFSEIMNQNDALF